MLKYNINLINFYFMYGNYKFLYFDNEKDYFI